MAALLPTPIDGCEQFTTKNKAMVREGVELSTDKVTELGAGVKVDAVERSKNAKGDNRLRITSPVAGWLSEKTVEPFVRYDFLVVGPTGVVGGWMLKLLAEMDSGTHALLLPDDKKPTWAIAGRTKSKVEALGRQYGVKAFVVDEKDAASFDRAVDAAKVVLAAAGPYRQKGPRMLLAACAHAAHKVVYFDLTGEYLLVGDVVKKHATEAAEKGNSLVQMVGPQEILTTEFGASLAVARLKERTGCEAPFLEILTCANGAMSGGSVASGTMMQLEEKREKLDDPWGLTLDQAAVEGRDDVPAGWKADVKEAWTDDRWGGAVHLGPAPLATGDCRILRRTAHALRWNGSRAAGVKMYTIFENERSAKFMVYSVTAPPQQTLKAIEQGRLPKRGEGPTAAQSYGSAFTDVVIAHGSDASTTSRDGDVAVCSVIGEPGLGHGAACGYVGSAYCMLVCGMAALRHPATAGAGLTPLTAFAGGGDILARLKAVGYAFDLSDALPTGESLAAGFKRNAAGEKLKATFK